MILKNSIRTPAMQLCLAFSIILVAAVMASAYTVVLRGGRHVEIPEQFSVTPITLTYEISPGIQVTLLMSAIDIPATERINKEPPGSLLRRGETAGGLTAPSGRDEIKESNAVHTITNRNLEAYKQTRQQSEIAYEKRRKELGLPSLDESKGRAAAQAAAMDEMFVRGRTEEAEAESYWRGQAAALRNEMTGVDAEIRYTRLRLDELSGDSGFGSFGLVTNGSQFGGFGIDIPFGRSGYRSPYGGQGARPNVVFAPNSGRRGAVRFGGGMTRGNVLLNPGASQYPRRNVRGSRPSYWPNGGWNWPSQSYDYSPSQSYDYSYERSSLVTRLDELLGRRASLDAQWQMLEDDARRAGAPPGWLRP